MAAPDLRVDNTLGALFVGISLSVLLLGFTFVQTWYYHRHYSDGIWVQLTVYCVLILETLHVALGLHGLYYWLISLYGNPTALMTVPWTIIITADERGDYQSMTSTVVLFFYAHRVYIVSGERPLIPALIAFMTLAKLVLAWIQLGFVAKQRDISSIENSGKHYTPASLSAGVVSNILVAASLCYFLHVKRTGYNRSGVIIDRILLYTLSNGVLTSALTIIALICQLAQPKNFIWVGFSQVLGNAYANSFLATLNSRRATRLTNDTTELELYPGRGITTRSSAAQGIKIHRSVVTVVDPPREIIPALRTSHSWPKSIGEEGSETKVSDAMGGKGFQP